MSANDEIGSINEQLGDSAIIILQFLSVQDLISIILASKKLYMSILAQRIMIFS
jgi:hypothetical protein